MEHYGPLSHSGEQETPSDGLPDNSAVESGTEATRLEYLQSVLPPAKKRRRRSLILLGIIGALLLAIGIYLAVAHTHKSRGHQAITDQSVHDNTTTHTKHYVSNGSDLNLAFDYPANWTVSPASGGNTNDQTITLNSPLASITSAGGETLSGKVTVLIRAGDAQLDELNNNAVAAQNSVQFAYNQPTSTQHQFPYLTFLHIGSGGSATFQEVIVTGATQFTQGTTITPMSISVDPIISASFYSCAAPTCTGNEAKPVSITNDTWQNSAIFQQVLAVFQSMQLH